jgi:hypothetical protein
MGPDPVIKGRVRAHAPGRPVFTEKEILHAIRTWTREFGEPPTTADWDVALAHRKGELWRVERRGSRVWPTPRMVRGQFGTLSSAIRAAGFNVTVPQRPRRHCESPDEILEAIRRWADRYGEPPAGTDWEPSRAQRLGHTWRVARYYADDWPSTHAVRRHFGTIALAVEAAGLQPRRQGQRTRRNPCLSPGAKLALRSSGPAESPSVERHRLAANIQAVLAAQGAEDGQALHAALVDLAVSALRWAEGVHPSSISGSRPAHTQAPDGHTR